jgi:vaccinia related kinase
VGDDAGLAMKIEPHENGPLFVEMNFYIRAAQPKDVDAFRQARGLKALGMPVLRGSGSHVHNGSKYRFLVMDRFGKDIQKIFHDGKNYKPFSTKAAFTLAVKIVSKMARPLTS